MKKLIAALLGNSGTLPVLFCLSFSSSFNDSDFVLRQSIRLIHPNIVRSANSFFVHRAAFEVGSFLVHSCAVGPTDSALYLLPRNLVDCKYRISPLIKDPVRVACS